VGGASAIWMQVPLGPSEVGTDALNYAWNIDSQRSWTLSKNTYLRSCLLEMFNHAIGGSLARQGYSGISRLQGFLFTGFDIQLGHYGIPKLSWHTVW